MGSVRRARLPAKLTPAGKRYCADARDHDFAHGPQDGRGIGAAEANELVGAYRMRVGREHDGNAQAGLACAA